MKIKVLHIFTAKLLNLFDDYKLPTVTALPENEREDVEKINSFQCFTKIAILPQSKSIVVMEPKFYNQTFNEHVITAFIESGSQIKSQLIYSYYNK